MCGIVGAAFMSPLPDPEAVARALQSIAHRGPDAQKSLREAGLVLGHTRLAVIDLSADAEQPMASADGKAVVVFNGEIYNHRALRTELEQLGARFRTRSDTEVIVEGYRLFGEAFVERLDGMFAFGLYDRAQRRLWLVRDRAGKKPLFYAQHHGGIAFASSIAALEALGVDAPLDPMKLQMLMVLGYVPAPATLRRRVHQLEPAHTMMVGPDQKAVQRRYWRAPFAAPRLRLSTEEATGAIRHAVRAAVLRRLEADVPLGAFLSGGIDSTIVVGTMARETSKQVKTFSIGFAGDPRFDETHFARMAAKRFDTDHTEFTLDHTAFSLLDKLVDHHDGPFGDSSAIPTSKVAELTRQHVTVALSGDGGDELFAGYTRFLAAEAAEWLPMASRTVARSVALRLPRGSNERTLYARGRRFLAAAGGSLADRVLIWQTYFADPSQILRHDLVSDAQPAWRWNRDVFQHARGNTVLAHILAHNFATYLPYDLLVKADRASMLHALEVRSPFLDTALIELAARLPDDLLRRGRSTKWVLKRAFSDLLPQEIVHRPKMGFGMPLGTWFRGPLQSVLDERLASPRMRLFDYVDFQQTEKLLADHRAGRADHGHKLFLLLTLSSWLERAAKA